MATKKNFKHIPEIKSIWKNKTRKELRLAVLEYYREHLAGKTIRNDDLGIDIVLTMKSGRKTAKGEAMYYKKAEVIRFLPDIIKYALYNNFGNRKDSDPKEVLGFLNFKGMCIIDGKKETLRIAVQYRRQSKYYYNVEVNTCR